MTDDSIIPDDIAREVDNLENVVETYAQIVMGEGFEFDRSETIPQRLRKIADFIQESI